MSQPAETLTGLEKLTTEILYRCVATVCVGFSPARIAAIAEPLEEALVEMVIIQDKETPKVREITTSNYVVFELLNRILDMVELEIPVAAYIELKTAANRTDRRRFLSGAWKGAK